MTAFRKFDHVERLGHLETHGLDDGTCHVFAKLDGSNGSVWLDEAGQVQCGSRNQQLSDSRDNHGFRAFVLGDDPRAASLRAALTPGFVYYGEWLVRHTIQCYQPKAWRRFWVFDVLDVATGRYVPWDDYGPALMSLGVDVLEPLAVLQRPTSAQLSDQMLGDRTLLLAGGTGEGIVVKRYDWTNRFGRQPWAKLINVVSMGKGKASKICLTSADLGASLEASIAAKFVTAELVEKVWSKCVAAIAQDQGMDLMRDDARQLIESQFRGKLIPQLLGRVYSDLIREEMWAIVKEAKNPRIDFGLLERSTKARVKELAADLFGGVVPQAVIQ